jgi:hypothetical protein
MMNGSIPGSGRVLAPLVVGIALLAAGCGGGGGSTGASGSSDYQKDLAFAHCMRTHGVPDFPDPLPQGGFPRGGPGNSPQFGLAMHACQHLLPAIQPISALQQAQVLAHDLKWAKCMRARGFPGISDPAVRPHGGIVITVPASFDPSSPQARAAAKACKQLEGPALITPGGGS